MSHNSKSITHPSSTTNKQHKSKSKQSNPLTMTTSLLSNDNDANNDNSFQYRGQTDGVTFFSSNSKMEKEIHTDNNNIVIDDDLELINEIKQIAGSPTIQ
tara:strand:- start:424 stop:723 length:300 start_codon:yes stop_codon:yes gene_type:complete